MLASSRAAVSGLFVLMLIALAAAKSATPMFSWAQTSSTVDVTIFVPLLYHDSIDVSFSRSKMVFTAEDDNEKPFRLVLELFGRIKPRNSDWEVDEHHSDRVVLSMKKEKTKDMHWERLLDDATALKKHMIIDWNKYDQSDVDEDDSDEIELYNNAETVVSPLRAVLPDGEDVACAACEAVVEEMVRNLETADPAQKGLESQKRNKRTQIPYEKSELKVMDMLEEACKAEKWLSHWMIKDESAAGSRSFKRVPYDKAKKHLAGGKGWTPALRILPPVCTRLIEEHETIITKLLHKYHNKKVKGLNQLQHKICTKLIRCGQQDAMTDAIEKRRRGEL